MAARKKHGKNSWKTQEKWEKWEMDDIRQKVLVHAGTLAGEMNFRLLFERDNTDLGEDPLLQGILFLAGKPDLWRELCYSQRILFVESITVTDIAFPVGKENGLQESTEENKQGFLSRIRSLLSLFGRGKRCGA